MTEKEKQQKKEQLIREIYAELKMIEKDQMRQKLKGLTP